jgi:hypothetical protein
MTHKVADDFFNDIDFTSIISTIKGIMTSDGSMSVLLDYERVLDEADLYAYKNWLLGELVQGPDIGRYSVACVFMWPSKLMPDPRGAKRLLALGCKLQFAKSKVKIPVEVKDYEDFVPGTRYPKAVEKKVWFVRIEIPLELMDDIKEGSIDLADQTIDLDDIEDAYNEDLDKAETQQNEQGPADNMAGLGPNPMGPGPGPTAMGPPPGLI